MAFALIGNKIRCYRSSGMMSHLLPHSQSAHACHSVHIDSYLGVSIFTDNNSDIGLVRRHGAKSSSTKSPWQPVRSATLRFTCNGSFCMAHGDNAEPLMSIARVTRSRATGDTISIFANAAPVLWPISVTLAGSPLNAGRFSRSQCKPATRSISPKLPWALPLAPVFKKPVR